MVPTPQTFAYQKLVGQYMDMASCTLAFFDWMITLDLEVSLIWNSNWSFTKVAFLVNRYLPVLDFVLNFTLEQGFIPIGACKAAYAAEGCVYLVGIYIAEYIFALRTCVVWNMKNRMFIVLTLFYLGTFAYNAYNYFGSVAPLHFFSVPPVTGCAAFQPKDPKIYISYIVLVVYDAAMLALMVYPTAKNHSDMDRVITNSNLMKTVYAEGVLFYAYLLVLSGTALVVEIQVPDNVYLFTLVNRMIRSVLACRVILNIRELFAKEQIEPSSTGGHLSTMSEMRFT